MTRKILGTLTVTALLAVGAIALIAEPGRSLGGWLELALFTGSKLLGVCLIGAAWSLFNRWKGDAIINALTRWIEEEK